LKRGELYQTNEKVPERVYKPGFYVVVSRNFIAENEDDSTVVCAPAYSEILELRSEVVLGMSENLPQDCALRCDFPTLTFTRKLTHFVGSLPGEKLRQLDDALCYALGIQG
jgi:mRNA-degrading endonuclease toxin of MazEF toxin-antitoxin module